MADHGDSRKSSRTSKASLSALSQLGQTGVSLSVGLFVTPIIVGGIGAAQYGIWVMISQICTYLSLIDIGNATILKYLLAAQQHTVDHPRKRRLISAAFVSQVVSLPLFILVLAWMTAFVPPLLVSGEQPILEPGTLRTAFFLSGLTFLIARFTALLGFVLFGCNRDYHSSLRRTGVQIFSSCLDVIAMASGMGLIALAVNKALSATLGVVITWRAVRSVAPWFGFSQPYMEEFKGTVKGNVQYLLSQWGSILSEMVDITLVGFTLGATVAAAFSLTTSLARMAILTLSAMLTAGTPGLADLFGQGKFDRFWEANREIALLALLSFAVTGPAIIALNGSFVASWVGSAHFAGNGVTIAGVMFFCTLTVARLNQQAAYACQLFKETIRSSLEGGLVGFVAALVGLRLMGASGVPLGLALGRLWTIKSVRGVLRTQIGTCPEGKTKSYVRPVLTLVAILLLSVIWAYVGPAATWYVLVPLGAMIGAAGGALFIAVGLRGEDQSRMMKRISGICRRFMPSRRC
jgi:O-antigen/teichoic acid export membrane protein